MKSTAAAMPTIANKSSYVPESGPNAGKKLDLTNKVSNAALEERHIVC
jgi:hypothetical protein